MITKQGVLLAACGLTAVGWLHAQDTLPQSANSEPIVLNVTVTDESARVIKGLKPTQFRIWEDGIPRTIATFAEGGQQALRVNADGSTSPLDRSEPAGGPSPQGGDPELGLLLDNIYTISYYPDPSNRNEGFRKIRLRSFRTFISD